MVTRLALAAMLVCCASAAADEVAPGQKSGQRYPDRDTSRAAPRVFEAAKDSAPLETSRGRATEAEYPLNVGATHPATLESSRNVNVPYTEPPAAKEPSATPEPLRISPAGTHKTRGKGGVSGESGSASRTGGRMSLVPVFGSLGVVLGLFFLVMWVLRRGMPKSSQSLPTEVVEVLGRTALGSRQHAHLLRCGNKLLLVSLSATGAETLTEVTDPIEVDRLAGLCRQSQPHSATATFRNIFQQFGRDRTARGFLSTTERESVASLADLHDEPLDGSTEEFHA